MRRLMAMGGVMGGSYAMLEDERNEHIFRQYVPIANRPLADKATHTFLHRYTRRKIVTPNGDIEFLAPEAWSDWQALQSALGGSFPP